MNARLNYFADPTAGKALKHFMSAGKALKDSPLPTATQELVALRVSQINGCAVCIDMHTKEAAAAGETSARLCRAGHPAGPGHRQPHGLLGSLRPR
jgi:AhpD family alkylhydroperoxidase